VKKLGKNPPWLVRGKAARESLDLVPTHKRQVCLPAADELRVQGKVQLPAKIFNPVVLADTRVLMQQGEDVPILRLATRHPQLIGIHHVKQLWCDDARPGGNQGSRRINAGSKPYSWPSYAPLVDDQEARRLIDVGEEPSILRNEVDLPHSVIGEEMASYALRPVVGEKRAGDNACESTCWTKQREGTLDEEARQVGNPAVGVPELGMGSELRR
jgi:hypothetical protein